MILYREYFSIYLLEISVDSHPLIAYIFFNGISVFWYRVGSSTLVLINFCVYTDKFSSLLNIDLTLIVLYQVSNNVLIRFDLVFDLLMYGF